MTTSRFKITDYANGFIRTYDDLLTQSEHNHLLSELSNLKFSHGESDESDTPPSGMICDLIPEQHHTHNVLERYLKDLDFLQDCYVDRSYVNLFAPNERTYFHHDFTDYTAIYYPGPRWNINDEGETKFFFTNNPFDCIIQEQSEDMPVMISIAPIPNRLVVFKGDVLHSATSFREAHRFSIAFKFLRKNV